MIVIIVSFFKRNYNKAIIHVFTLLFFTKNTITGEKEKYQKQQQKLYQKNYFCKQLSQEFSLQANIISFYIKNIFLKKSNQELLWFKKMNYFYHHRYHTEANTIHFVTHHMINRKKKFHQYYPILSISVKKNKTNIENKKINSP